MFRKIVAGAESCMDTGLASGGLTGAAARIAALGVSFRLGDKLFVQMTRSAMEQAGIGVYVDRFNDYGAFNPIGQLVVKPLWEITRAVGLPLHALQVTATDEEYTRILQDQNKRRSLEEIGLEYMLVFEQRKRPGMPVYLSELADTRGDRLDLQHYSQFVRAVDISDASKITGRVFCGSGYAEGILFGLSLG